MRKTALIAVLTLGLIGPAWGQTLAEVGGVPITMHDVVQANPKAKTDAKLRQRVLIALVNRQAVINAAHKDGIDKTAQYRQNVADAKASILINLMAKKYEAAHPVTEKAIKAKYDSVFSKKSPTQYRLREIITSSFKTAKEALDKIRHGADFSIVAANMSTDQSSSQLGGELGWQFASRLPAPILKVVRTLKVKQVAGPISVPQGDAVIQLLGERSAPKPSLDQVKEQIKKALAQQDWVHHVLKLRADQGAHLIVPLSGK